MIDPSDSVSLLLAVPFPSSAAAREIPAAPAVEIDPTGAGDVFGVVLALGLAAGKAPPEAGADAAHAAARVIEGPGLGRLVAPAAAGIVPVDQGKGPDIR